MLLLSYISVIICRGNRLSSYWLRFPFPSLQQTQVLFSDKNEASYKNLPRLLVSNKKKQTRTNFDLRNSSDLVLLVTRTGIEPMFSP